MSETTTDKPPEEPVQPPGDGAAPDAPAADDAPQEGEQPPTEGDEPKQPDPEAKKAAARIRHLNARANAERQRADAAEIELAKARELLAAQQNGDKPPAAPQQPTTQEQIRAEAQRLLAEERVQVERANIIKAGVAEFGAAEWNEKTEILTTMGALAKPEFMEALTADPEVAHKIVVALVDDPDMLASILTMRPAQMAARMGRLAAELSVTEAKPKTEISRTPAPVKPIGPRSAPAPREPTPGTKEWFAWRNQTAPRHLGGQGKAA